MCTSPVDETGPLIPSHVFVNKDEVQYIDLQCNASSLSGGALDLIDENSMAKENAPVTKPFDTYEE
eukprot:Ihof_evm6s317 gene=Ihof_evmTU6s317